jgi:hypothetical protein
MKFLNVSVAVVAMEASLAAWHTRRMRVLFLAASLSAIALSVSGCGGTHRAAAPPAPLWVRRANALCKPIDRRFKSSDELFTSAAWFAKFRREVFGLQRLGFFIHVPAAAADMETAQRLFAQSQDTRKLDVALRRVRRDAAQRGVQCSFGSVPLLQA